MTASRSILFVLLIAVAIRGGVLWGKRESLSADPDAYRAIATSLTQTGVFGVMIDDAQSNPTAFRPPLYPYLLSWLPPSNLAIGMLHLILGVLTVAMIWDIARQLFGIRTAMFAALLVTFDPILVWQSTLVMTETLAALLATLVMRCWVWRPKNYLFRAVGLGVALSLAILCRPTFVVWAALLIAAMLLPSRLCWNAGCPVRRTAAALVAGLFVFATLGSWTLRNQIVLGHPIWATSHGGYTLLLANNRSFYEHLRTNPPWGHAPWAVPAWDPTEFFQHFQEEHVERLATADEIQRDREAYNEARQTISDQPGMFAYSCIIRFSRLWQPFPHATGGRSGLSVFAVGLYYVVSYVLLVAMIWRHRMQWLSVPYLPIWTLALTLSAVHAVYWSNPRMRAPVIPLLALAIATHLCPRTDFLSRASTQHEDTEGRCDV